MTFKLTMRPVITVKTLTVIQSFATIDLAVIEGACRGDINLVNTPTSA